MSIDRTGKFRSVIDPEWEKTRNHFSPSYRITPPFPSVWPPGAGISLFYYVFAVDSMAAFDGEMIGSVFGRIEVPAEQGAKPAFKRLSDEVHKIGIQGVRPLQQFEIEIYRQTNRIEEYLKNLNSPPDEQSEEAQLTKQFYRLWFDNSGISAEIRPYHEEFFRWVGQAKPPRKRWWKFW